ncbi:hypothetical protein [Streptomyces sp. A012304]|uniref:hypothetical protein n=1 Tax=Streptomyces sp. A012304 TaxID=375446 RepID=UPI0022309BDC|nr:hypothetical protein [Streptomyces sp. A012304]GKQ35680.1 hypothetical protein ALMP_22230 [Streptomyces sp. A012304]
MSEVRSVPADYGRSRLTARTRWRATRRGRRDGKAGIGTDHYTRQLERGLRMALEDLRSRFVTRHARDIDSVHEESARIVTEYDHRREDVPAALARFGGWVSQWRTEVTACQQRGLALAACADQELAHYEAAYARAARQDPSQPTGTVADAVLDETWTGAPDWMLDDALVRRALQILEQRIGPAPAASGRAGRGTR